MSNWNATYNKVLKNEGGYARPFGLSGETYKGIDRKYHPTWAGWAIIDQIKRSRGGKGIREGEKFNSNTRLEKLVSDFYRAYLGKMVNVEAIQNQYLADMVADFIVHKQYDAVDVINHTAGSIYPVRTSPTAVTSDTITLANNTASQFYKALRNNRIAYYKNPQQFPGTSVKGFSTPLVQAFVRRVMAFPVAIPLSGVEWIKSLFKR